MGKNEIGNWCKNTLLGLNINKVNEMEQMLNFELTLNECNMILTALGELPAKNTMSLILKLQEQAKNQLDSSAVPSEG